jgi:hypothetical protein
MIAVDYRIGKSLPEGYFDIHLVELIDEQLHEPHELIHKWRDGRKLAHDRFL